MPKQTLPEPESVKNFPSQTVRPESSMTGVTCSLSSTFTIGTRRFAEARKSASTLAISLTMSTSPTSSTTISTSEMVLSGWWPNPRAKALLSNPASQWILLHRLRLSRPVNFLFITP